MSLISRDVFPNIYFFSDFETKSQLRLLSKEHKAICDKAGYFKDKYSKIYFDIFLPYQTSMKIREQSPTNLNGRTPVFFLPVPTKSPEHPKNVTIEDSKTLCEAAKEETYYKKALATANEVFDDIRYKNGHFIPAHCLDCDEIKTWKLGWPYTFFVESKLSKHNMKPFYRRKLEEEQITYSIDVYSDNSVNYSHARRLKGILIEKKL